ncbi:UPF0561 protein C2orf68 homolog [Gouania willdenowi]|uniref:Uncharacterized protein n=1 Tax=Gouania willdenowi TaxID=441366 RepID=A0A8C5EAM2_GOUWI|nr:UPF0561 protein C2orf68 homolog [Gouania willdenowi]
MDILRDEGVQDLKYKPGGRLDMSHGFVHHIRRNQKARDDYDREVKQAKEQKKKRHTTTPRRPRRPDIQVYHPQRRPHGSEAGADTEEWNESGSSTDTETQGTELFWLDYQADSGSITSFIVYKEDRPEKVVEHVAEKNNLDPGMRAALKVRIEKEMDKRRDKR